MQKILFDTDVILDFSFDIFRQAAPHGKVLEKLTQLLKIHLLPVDEEVVLQALNPGFRYFEDALQTAAAIIAKSITVIITRKGKDYGKTELGDMTPDNCLKQLVNFNTLNKNGKQSF